MRSLIWLSATLVLLIAGCGRKAAETTENSAQSYPPSTAASEKERPPAEPPEVTADDFKRGQAGGKRMPFFEMRPIEGDEVLTLEMLRGQVVLLDFWASWCGPCKAAIPSLKRLHEEFGSKGLTVIGANAGEARPGPEPAKKYKEQHAIPYKLTYDNDQLVRILGIEGYPAFILFDQDGVVRMAQLGFDEDWMMGAVRNEIKRLLGS